MEKPYKAIISLSNIEIDSSQKDDLKCVLIAGDETKESNIPFRDIFCFDLSEDCEKIVVKFILDAKDDVHEEFVQAESHMEVPCELDKSPEIEKNEKLKQEIENQEVDLPYIYASFNLTFINTNKFETKAITENIPTEPEEKTKVEQERESFTSVDIDLDKEENISDHNKNDNGQKLQNDDKKTTLVSNAKLKVMMEERERRDKERLQKKEEKNRFNKIKDEDPKVLNFRQEKQKKKDPTPTGRMSAKYRDKEVINGDQNKLPEKNTPNLKNIKPVNIETKKTPARTGSSLHLKSSSEINIKTEANNKNEASNFQKFSKTPKKEIEPLKSPSIGNYQSNPRPSQKQKERESYSYEENAQTGYLNKIVNKHYEDAKEKTDKDLIETGNCIILNKFNSLSNTNHINSDLISPTKLNIDAIRRDRIDTLDLTSISNNKNYREQAEIFTNLENSQHLLNSGRLKSNISIIKRAESVSSISELGNFSSNNFKRNKAAKNEKLEKDMTNLIMETESKRYLNDSKNQIDYLKMIIYNLDNQIQRQTTYEGETYLLREEVEKSNVSREELRKSLLETTHDLREESSKFNNIIHELETHNKDILSSQKESHNLIGDLQSQIHRQEIKYNALEGETSELRLKVKTVNVFKNQLDNYKVDLEIAHKKHSETISGLTSNMLELEKDTNDLQSTNKDLLEKNRELNTKIGSLEAEMTFEKGNYNILKGECNNLQKKVRLNKTANSLMEAVDEQTELMTREIEKVRLENENYHNQISYMENSVLQGSRMLEEANIKRNEEVTKLMGKLQKAEMSLNMLRQDNNALKKDNVELKSHIISLEQLICVKEDVYSQLQNGLDRLSDRQNDCDKMRGRLEASDRINLSQEDKIFEIEKCQIYLKNTIEQKDDYILNMIKVIMEIKDKTKVYIPTDDEIDQRLAEFINSSNEPEKLTKLFLREKAGVYAFGNKRVYVKMESGKIFVKVGGGFQSVEEFLKNHAGSELDKMLNKDPLSIFANNIATNRVLAGRAVTRKDNSFG